MKKSIGTQRDCIGYHSDCEDGPCEHYTKDEPCAFFTNVFPCDHVEEEGTVSTPEELTSKTILEHIKDINKILEENDVSERQIQVYDMESGKHVEMNGGEYEEFIKQWHKEVGEGYRRSAVINLEDDLYVEGQK